METKYNILCDGCSYSRSPGHNTNWVGFLPRNTFNIAKQGSGIQAQRLERFLNEETEFPSLEGWNKNIGLTHFIYQVPTPTRQPVNLNDFDDNHFKVRFSDHIKRDELTPEQFSDLKNSTSTIWRHLRHLPLWRKVKRQGLEKHLHEVPTLDVFKNHDKYMLKALEKVKYNVNLVRRAYSDIKIIFLRYEKNNGPLFYEFHRDFFKSILSNYCKENDITYIYEKNFHTNWFKQQKMTKDETHPNKLGARFIAEKVKEYL